MAAVVAYLRQGASWTGPGRNRLLQAQIARCNAATRAKGANNAEQNGCAHVADGLLPGVQLPGVHAARRQRTAY